MAVNDHKRLSKGRQKIDIKKIDNKNRLHVTFSKRRTGLFKKAAELHLLTGAEIAVIVQSPANKIYVFGSPSADSVIHRYENEVTSVNNDPSFCNPLLQESHVDNNVQRQPDLEVVGMFGSKKEERKTIENKVSMAVNCGNDDDGDLSWFEELVDLENIYMFGIPGVNNDASFSNSLLQESEDDDNNIKHQHNGEVMGMFGPKNEEGKSIENKDSVAVSGGNDDDELSWFEELVDMEVSNNPSFSNPLQQESVVDHNIQHRHNVEVMGMFGDEKSIENKVPVVVSGGGGLNWFGEEADAAAMGLEEAEKYLSALETLRDNLLSQANWLALSRDLQQRQPQCMHYQGIWSTERFFNGSWG